MTEIWSMIYIDRWLMQWSQIHCKTWKFASRYSEIDIFDRFHFSHLDTLQCIMIILKKALRFGQPPRLPNMICCFVFLFFCILQHWGLAVMLPLVGMLLRLCKPPQVQVQHMMLIWLMHLFCYIMYIDTGSGMKSWALTYSLGTIRVSLVSLFLDSKAHDSWLWHKTNRSFKMFFCN